MDRYNKWETHYNYFYGMPFHGESAGTSHFHLEWLLTMLGQGMSTGLLVDLEILLRQQIIMLHLRKRSPSLIVMEIGSQATPSCQMLG